MRYNRHFYRHVYGLCAHLASVVAIVAAVVADFCRLALRIDYGHAWRTTRDLGITAYRKISDLKPVYRESYDTHGLSLSGRAA